MGIKANFTKQSLNNYFAQVLRIIDEEISKTLAYLGEKAISRIRDTERGGVPGERGWKDHTGNLRSSIGYAVAEHGRNKIESTFEQVLDGTEGSAKGRELVESLVSQYKDTYALIVVAGMDYADRVEAIEGKDVLASTELWARSVIDEYIQNTTSKIEKRISKLSL